MKKIVKFIQNIKRDKLEHRILGDITFYPLALIAYSIALNTSIDIVEAINYSGIIATVGYAAKEIVYDGIMSKGTPEFWDWFYTSISVFEILSIVNLINLMN